MSRRCLAVANHLSMPAVRGGNAVTSIAATPPFFKGSGESDGEPVNSCDANSPSDGWCPTRITW